MKPIKININNKDFQCLLAESQQEQETGLMYIKPPVPNMAFSYSSPTQTIFWMKNTPAPLDIIFCCKNKIIDIKQGKPYSTDLIKPSGNCDLVIEFNRGSVSLFGFKIGDDVFINEH